jgi:hypothetical protein
MNASIARIASRIKMKQKGIKILSICGAIHGLALLFPTTAPRSTIRQLDLLKQTLAGIAAKNFSVRIQLSITWIPSLLWNVIEIIEFIILLKFINSGNATMRRNSSVQITSDSI